MSRVRKTPFVLAVLVASVALAAVAHAAPWSHLRSATVTVQNGSLAPPYGRAHVHRFTTSAAVAEVTKALNANHIASRHPTANDGCAGGFNLTLKLVGRTTQTLTAYECGGHTYGKVAGDVNGFLSALGISAP